MEKFDIDGWYSVLLETPYNYKNLKYYIQNNAAKSAYLNSVSPKQIFSVTIDKEKGNEVILVDFDGNSNKRIFLNPIDRAFYHYSNQVIVILSTYLELIIKEFFEIFFFYKNHKIKSISGYIDLQSILKTNSRKELLMYISQIAATNATKGGIKLRIEKIEKICKETFNEKLKKNLCTLIKRRNEIVHGNKLYDIDDIIIDRTSDNITTLLTMLGKILKKSNIPIINESGLCV